MAKNRIINTKFWSDTFIVDELNPLDRYLFLYLLTNEKTNNIGIYEISIRTIAFETGIEKDSLIKMIDRLKDKVLYIDGWVCFKNFVKHQSPNPNQQIGMERVWEGEVSASIKEKLIPFAKDFKGFIKDSLLNLTLLNSTLPNLKGEEISKEIPVVTKVTTLKDLMLEYINKQKYINLGISEDIIETELNKFYSYWVQKNAGSKKEHRQKQKTFEVSRRFDFWLSNNKTKSLQAKKGTGITTI